MVAKDTLVVDLIFFIKDDLNTNITDPSSSTRPSKSNLVMTSYPQRPVVYPIVTVKVTNIEAIRAGMQTTAQDITLTLEIRIWARNEKEKEQLYDDILSRLADIQFTSSTGSIANNIHDFTVLSSNEIDEPGEAGGKTIKSRVLQIQYRFYDV